MKRVKVLVDGIPAGEIQELELGRKYRFVYLNDYEGSSVSLEIPIAKELRLR